MSTQTSKFKQIIRKLVTEQIDTDRTLVRELAEMDKAVKTINKDCRAMINNSFSRIVLDDGMGGNTFDVQIYPKMDLSKEGMGRYELRAYIHDSDRIYKNNLSCEDICKFIKEDLKDLTEDEDSTYVRKALEKGKRPSWEDPEYDYEPQTLAEGVEKTEYSVINTVKHPGSGKDVTPDVPCRIIQRIGKVVMLTPGNSGHEFMTTLNNLKFYEKSVNLSESKKKKEGGAPSTREQRDLKKYKELKAKKDLTDSEKSMMGLLKTRLDRLNLLEDKSKKKDKKEDNCNCESTVGEMEEVKEKDIKKQKDWTPAEYDIKDEELPGLDMNELAEKIENAVWGAIKREVESTHQKTAKAEHDVKDSDTKKDGHTVTKQKRNSKKTSKMTDKPKDNETSKSLKKSGKGGDSKVDTPKIKDEKKENRKAKQDGDKDEEMKPAKK